MFGLDNKSGINVMPPIAPADSQTPLWFTEGGAGLSATYPGQDWFNQIQAELLNVLNAAEITPQKGNLTQLSSAISKLASAYALSVVQKPGTSTTAVLSQAAVNTHYAKKNSSDPLTTGTLHINPFGDVTSCAFHRKDSSYFVIETSTDGSVYLVDVNKDGTITGKITFPAGYGTLLTKGQADNHYPLKTDLGTAAEKNTGTGSGQIPDMSYFISTKTSSAIVEQLPTGIIRMSGVSLVSTDVNGNCWVQLPSTFPNRVMFYAGEQNGSNYAGDSSPWLFTPYTNSEAGVTRLSFAVRRSTTGEVMKNDTISMKFTAEGY